MKFQGVPRMNVSNLVRILVVLVSKIRVLMELMEWRELFIAILENLSKEFKEI